MTSPKRIRDLVLVGGGHSHVQVLRRLAMEPLPDVRLTIVLDVPIAVYSGMVPGFVAGQYTAEELEIDVVPLARRAGARVILSPAVSIDAEARRIQLKDRPPLRYDVASIDIGSTVAGLDAPGVREHALPTRPISRLVDRLDDFLEKHAQAERLRVAVVGAGAGGVELAFTLDHRLRNLLQRSAEVHLLTSDSRILRGYPESLVRRLLKEAEKRGIQIACGRRVQAVESNRVRFNDGDELPCEAVVWVTGATGHDVFRKSGLPTDDRGFVSTRSTLQVSGFDDLFAVGDCATLLEYPQTPKAGVYAVRQGPYLVENLRAFLAGKPLKPYRPQSDFLTLLNLGDGSALGCKKGLTFGGRWVMRLKDWIDRRFMEKFQVLEASGTMTEAFRALPEMEMEGGAMLCGGCAAKVGQSVLERALGRLEENDRGASLLLGPGDDAAAFETPGGEVIVSTIDAFRAFTDDPYLVGEVAAINAVSDLLAKGIEPRFYQALAVLPEDEPAELVEETLFQVMAGMRAALDPLGATLLGGHTSTAPGLMVGLTVEGFADSKGDLLSLDGLAAGHHLILTKALGTGVLFHADMQGKARGPWVETALVSMRRSNRAAARIARQLGASAATDITGFGLIGHLGEMLRASGQGAVIALHDLPALPGSVELLRLGLRSTFHPENARARQGIRVEEGVDRHPKRDLLFDPQTSGGLLLALPEERAEEAIQLLHQAGDLDATIIGIVGQRREDGALIEVITEFG